MGTPEVNTPSVACVGPGPVCRRCGYRLVGLPVVGLCPECGTEYPPLGGVPRSPPLDAATMCRRLAWPLIPVCSGAVVLLLVEALTTPALRGVGVTLLVGGGLMSLINAPAQCLALSMEHAPLERQFGNPLGHLRGAERAGVVAALLAPPAAVAVLVVAVAMSGWI